VATDRQQVHVELRSPPHDRDGGDLQRADAVPQPRRQHLLHLDQGTERRLTDAGHTAAGRRVQRDGDRDGLVVVEQQRREGGPGAER
jgi:hypothetical protein